MELKHLIAVEKWTCGLAALVVAIALFALGRRTGLSLSLGAALMALNAWALRRIGQRVFRSFKRPGAAVLLFNLKMTLLLGLVWCLVRYLHVEPVPFLIGISIFPVAIVLVALRHSLGQGTAPLGPPTGDHEETHG